MHTCTVKIPDHLDRKLTKIAQKRRTTKSEIIREAMSQYVEQTRPTFANQALDLAGVLEGPSDLSHAAHHMEGYGS